MKLPEQASRRLWPIRDSSNEKLHGGSGLLNGKLGMPWWVNLKFKSTLKITSESLFLGRWEIADGFFPSHDGHTAAGPRRAVHIFYSRLSIRRIRRTRHIVSFRAAMTMLCNLTGRTSRIWRLNHAQTVSTCRSYSVCSSSSQLHNLIENLARCSLALPPRIISAFGKVCSICCSNAPSTNLIAV